MPQPRPAARFLMCDGAKTFVKSVKSDCTSDCNLETSAHELKEICEAGRLRTSSLRLSS